MQIFQHKTEKEQARSMQNLVIVTPCSRPANLVLLAGSIRFEHVLRWIIVHDTTSRPFQPITSLSNPKIQQFAQAGGISGNPQRNRALEEIAKCKPEPGTFVYFLDDDNVMHPNFWSILSRARAGKWYSFDLRAQLPCSPELEYLRILQRAPSETAGDRTGSALVAGRIDTAQFMVDFDLIRDSRWIANRYEADGFFIEALFRAHRLEHVYVAEAGAYYNFLRLAVEQKEMLAKQWQLYNRPFEPRREARPIRFASWKLFL